MIPYNMLSVFQNIPQLSQYVFYKQDASIQLHRGFKVPEELTINS